MMQAFVSQGKRPMPLGESGRAVDSNTLAFPSAKRLRAATGASVDKENADPQADVLTGRVLEEDRDGNNGADKLAVAGALLHQLPRNVVSNATTRKELARTTHRMMLEILVARRLHPASWKAPGKTSDADDAATS